MVILYIVIITCCFLVMVFRRIYDRFFQFFLQLFRFLLFLFEFFLQVLPAFLILLHRIILSFIIMLFFLWLVPSFQSAYGHDILHIRAPVFVIIVPFII